MIQLVIKSSVHEFFAFSFEDYLSSFITKVIIALVHHLNLARLAKECNRFDDK